MSSTVWLFVSLALLALVILAVLIWQRRTARPTPRNPVDDPIIDTDVQQKSDGTTIAVPRQVLTRAQQGWQRLNRSRVGPWIVAAALVVVLGLGFWAYQRMFGVTRAAEFVVVVAPFRDSGGDVGQTGRSVAQELALAIAAQPTTSERRMVVETVDDAPASGEAAYQLAATMEADVVVWGEVSPGGVLDQESLLPQLAYAPNGPYAPNVWDGYVGRFTMPGNFLVATSPINGKVIMPPLIAALADYADNDADLTFETFGRLAENYPMLAPALLHSFRGNVLWAQGAFDQAANEYQTALSDPTGDVARLANNLSAIYLDGSNGQALDAMDRSLKQLGAAQSDLGELRFNLALLALNQSRPQDAVDGLNAAKNGLLPQSTPLLVTLARAQREVGEFDAAAATLAVAERQSATDQASVPNSMRTLLREQHRAAIQEEQGLLTLAQLAGGKGPLEWELEAMSTKSSAAVQPARTALEAALASTNTVVASWRSSETTDAARNRSGASLIDNGQASRAEQTSDQRRLLVAMARLEAAREGLSRSPGFFGALFSGISGNDTSLTSVQGAMASQVSAEPDNINALIVYARALRLRRQFDEANRQYDNVISRAPLRPEGFYGKGMIALDNGDANGAKPPLNQALDRNQQFFPARQALAQIGIAAKDWPAAIDQLGWLADNRATPQDKVALGQVLRRSGSDGYQRAFAVLQPLADQNNVDALIELARLYNDSGNQDAARQAYEDAIKANPRSSPALFELGQTLAKQGDYPKAEQSLKAAIDADPTNIDARLSLAELYIGPLHQPDDAADLYGSLLKQGVSDPDTLAKMGDQLLERGRPADAIQAYRTALDRQPDNRFLVHKLGQAYLSQGNLEGARQSEQQALDMASGSFPQALAGLGDIARQTNNFDQALNYYNQALSQDGSLVGARLGLGQTVAAQGNWAVALGQFQDAAAREPDNAMAHFWVGEAQLRQGNLAGAIEAYNLALGLQPIFPEAELGLAQAQLDANNDRASGLATALATVNTALEQRPRYAEALLFKGKLLQEQSAFIADPEGARSKIDEALRTYSESINASDRLAEPYYRRGLIYLQRSTYGQAENDFQSAIDRQGNLAEAHYWLGRTYYAQSRLQNALNEFKIAVSLQGGGYAEALLYQGMVEQQMGDRNAAAISFQAVIQIDGGSQWATTARQELEQLQD